MWSASTARNLLKPRRGRTPTSSEYTVTVYLNPILNQLIILLAYPPPNPHEKDFLAPLPPNPPTVNPETAPSSEAPPVVDGDTTYIVSKHLQVKLTKFQQTWITKFESAKVNNIESICDDYAEAVFTNKPKKRPPRQRRPRRDPTAADSHVCWKSSFRSHSYQPSTLRPGEASRL
ncbi:hypothetical protein TNCV_1662211 [Trichonephila clavipes]|nr:hypothetical protein TNCV_1662211 [Trichonephila clavipes]